MPFLEVKEEGCKCAGLLYLVDLGGQKLPFSVEPVANIIKGLADVVWLLIIGKDEEGSDVVKVDDA